MASPPLPQRERLLTAGLLISLVFTTWAAGARHTWVELGTFLLTGTTFLLLVAPGKRLGAERWVGLRELLHFPPFWSGILFLAYLIVQIFNPSYLMLDAGNRQLDVLKAAPVDWLPSTISAPWWTPNAWRHLLWLATGWMALCVVSVGLRRRRALHILLWGIAINSTVFAVAGIIQQQLGSPEILWLDRTHPLQHLWVIFTNANHAGALLNLGLATCIGLFLHLTALSRTSITKGGPHLMLLPMAAIVFAGALQTYSRAVIALAIIQVLVFVLLCVALLFRQLRKQDNRGRTLVVSAVLIVLVTIGASGLSRSINNRNLNIQLRSLFAIVEGRQDVRVYINKATWDLIEDRPWYGWGIGSYRYFIPTKQAHYPEIMFKRGGHTVQLIYAHNEWLQYLAEVGIIGCIPLFFTLLYLPLRALRQLRGLNAGTIALAAGLALTAAHAWVEFFFEMPLLVLQYALILAATARLLELSSKRKRLEAGPAL